MKNALDHFAWWTFSTFIDIPKYINYIIYTICQNIFYGYIHLYSPLYGMYPLQYTNIEKRQKPWDTIPKLTVTIAGINPENMGVLLLLY